MKKYRVYFYVSPSGKDMVADYDAVNENEAMSFFQKDFFCNSSYVSVYVDMIKEVKSA
jgi:hypothetical protein